MSSNEPEHSDPIATTDTLRQQDVAQPAASTASASAVPDASDASGVSEAAEAADAREAVDAPGDSGAPEEPEIPEVQETAQGAGPAAAPAAQTPVNPAPLDPAACAQRLKQLWPALFTGAPKPLKLRIQVDIQQRAPGVFTKQALSAFFRRYTGSTSYLLAVAKGQQRFDLDGQPSGELSAEHRQVARDELARRRERHETRRALEEQERRNRAGLLRDYERTTLTRANFCVLKGVAEADLDGLLALAREEAAQPRTHGPHQTARAAERPGAPENAHPPGRRRGPARAPAPGNGEPRR